MKRLQLQRSVQHRMIPQIGVAEKRNYDSLKPFNGVNVMFRFSPEGEPGMFSGNLAAIVQNAGWNFRWGDPAKKNEIPDGVMVNSYVGPNGETDSSAEAAKSFATFLQAYGIAGVR